MSDLFRLLALHASAVVFVVTLLARLGAPLPAFAFLIVAGALSVSGEVALGGVVAAALLGNLLGDAAWFAAGRRWGHPVMHWLCRVSLSTDICVQRSEDILGRWGGLSLVAAKFVPGVSLVAPPMAGAVGMTVRRFLVYEALAASVWTLCFLALGRLFQDAVQDLLALFSRIGLAAGVLVALLIVVALVWRYRLRQGLQVADALALIDAAALHALLTAGAQAPTVIDVRAAAAMAQGPRGIEGALAIDLPELASAPLADWRAEGRVLVVYCDCPNDASARAAARRLRAAGLDQVHVLQGGLAAWQAHVAAVTAAGEAPGGEPVLRAA